MSARPKLGGRKGQIVFLGAIAVAALIAVLVTRGAGDEDEPGAPLDDPGAALSSGRCPLEASYFCTQLPDDIPLDPESEALTRELRNQAYGVAPGTEADCSQANLVNDPADLTPQQAAECTRVIGRAAVAYDSYAPMRYTVGPDQPRVPVVLDADEPSLSAAFAEGVPIPEEAVAAPGTDAQLIIHQPSTNTMWELWRGYQDAEGTWHAGWGGRMPDVSENPGHFTTIADPEADASAGEPPFAEQSTWGGPASSIPNLPGLATVEQLRSGTIGHAIVFSTWANKPGEWVYPAQRTDGRCRGDAAEFCSQIPQGARFRVDPEFDTSTIDHPIARMFAEAAQDYGMVLNNSTGSGVGFYAEGWRGHPEWGGDPYYGPGGLFRSDPSQLSSSLFMREFPWEHLEMIRRGTTCSDQTQECEPPADWASGTFAGSDAESGG